MIKMNLTKEKLTELRKGNPVILPMEFKECFECKGNGWIYSMFAMNNNYEPKAKCLHCNGTGQTSKYQVGDVIEVCSKGHDDLEFTNLIHRKYWYCYQCKEKYFESDLINLKIISIDKEKKEMRVM